LPQSGSTFAVIRGGGLVNRIAEAAMSQSTFDDRIARVQQRRRRLAAGATLRVGRDGLVTAHPRRAVLPRFPLRGILMTLAGFVVFKAVLLVQLGAATYEARLESLAAGTAIERAGAWVLQIDPATAALAELATGLLP
jgi:hypothetical protein